MAKSPTTFQPGQSGNPGGRSPRVTEDGKTVAQLARVHTEAAINRLAEIMAQPDPELALKAADALLNRGWGRPKESLDLDARVEGSGVPIIQIVRVSAAPEGDASA